MGLEDQEIIDDFVVESSEHLADIETQLLSIEASGSDIDMELVNTVFRGVHSIKGAAGFLGLTNINRLSHSLESVLNLMREGKLIPVSGIVDVMLRASDSLRGMISDVATSNEVDIDMHVMALDLIADSSEEINAGAMQSAKEKSAASNEPSGDSPQASAAEADASAAAAHAADSNHAETSNDAASKTDGDTEATPGGDECDPSPASEQKIAMTAGQLRELAQLYGQPQSCGPLDDDSELYSPTSLSAASSLSSYESAGAAAAERSVGAAAGINLNDGSSDNGRSENRPAGKGNSETSIRVSVETLDQLMNLAGELVLGRNQLLQTVASCESNGLEAVAARINQVTCEMQDAIMKTRMQPIGNVFNRFTRVVRDLSAKLNKQCDLTIEGREVEVDKTIIEAISDPLTHLIRNAVDHGLELPSARSAAGKNPIGKLVLRALHRSGKVCIEITDDGAGMNPQVIKNKAIEKGLVSAEQAAELSDRDACRLIFAPGFSTAEQLSDVSGRGVGMDVVRTNIERLGGTVEISSQLGKGTTIEVTLPLTLAIIPSLIVHCGSQRFAVPQVSISELVRIRPTELNSKIGRVKGSEVLRLRGHLLPLVRLGEALGIETGNTPASNASRSPVEAMNIIIVESGQLRYGLVVDGMNDSEEIVVKPLGRLLKDCNCLSGATILGDGRVALILDIGGIAEQVELGTNDLAGDRNPGCDSLDENLADRQSLLLLRNDESEQFAVPISLIARIERIRADQLSKVGRQLLLQSETSSLPLIKLEDHITARPRCERENLYVVVFVIGGREVGMLAPILHDTIDTTGQVDNLVLRETGVLGSVVIDGQATRLLDVFELVEKAFPEWSEVRVEVDPECVKHRLMVVEDSAFFRNQVKKYLVASGFEVVEACDGQEAWDAIELDPTAYDMVITDVHMPRMTGFELCKLIKTTPTTAHLPVIALTTLAGEENIERGQECGVDEYHIKVNREKLLKSVRMLLASSEKPNRPANSSPAKNAAPGTNRATTKQTPQLQTV